MRNLLIPGHKAFMEEEGKIDYSCPRCSSSDVKRQQEPGGLLENHCRVCGHDWTLANGGVGGMGG